MNKELKLPAKYDPAEERRLLRVATKGGRCRCCPSVSRDALPPARKARI